MRLSESQAELDAPQADALASAVAAAPATASMQGERLDHRIRLIAVAEEFVEPPWEALPRPGTVQAQSKQDQGTLANRLFGNILHIAQSAGGVSA
jgi:hypothetical protein